MNINVTLNYRDGELESVSLSKEAFMTLITSGKVTINAVGNILPEKANERTKNSLSLEKEISNTLTYIGIPRNIKGFKYLRDAIIMCTNDPNALNKITKVLYPTIASKNNDTPSRVERAIRHAIETAHTPANISKINSIFSTSYDPSDKKPTNSEIIALISDSLRLKNAG